MQLKSNIFQLFVLALSIPIFLSSCISGSTLQTARTVGQGNSEANVGFSGVSYGFSVDDGKDTISVSSPLMEIDYRYGVTDKLDIGARLSLIGTSGLYAKYQFLGNSESKIAGSAGLNLSYIQLSGGTSGNEVDYTVVDFTIPAYFSVHPASWVGIYASPRYTLRSAGGSISHWYGGTGGIRLGKRFGGFFEYSLFAGSSATKSLSQVTGGISIGF